MSYLWNEWIWELVNIKVLTQFTMDNEHVGFPSMVIVYVFVPEECSTSSSEQMRQGLIEAAEDKVSIYRI